MTEADRIFERFPPFIREYIFSHSWDTLRGVQIAAARTIFDTVDLSVSFAFNRIKCI